MPGWISATHRPKFSCTHSYATMTHLESQQGTRDQAARVAWKKGASSSVQLYNSAPFTTCGRRRPIAKTARSRASLPLDRTGTIVSKTSYMDETPPCQSPIERHELATVHALTVGCLDMPTPLSTSSYPPQAGLCMRSSLHCH